MADYEWIKQRGLRFRVVQVELPSSTDPSYVHQVVHLVQEPGEWRVRLECQTQKGSDLEVQDVMVVQNYDATAVNVERERDGAQWLLVIPRNAFGI